MCGSTSVNTLSLELFETLFRYYCLVESRSMCSFIESHWVVRLARVLIVQTELMMAL